MRKNKWGEIGRLAFQYSQEPDGYIPALADWVECQALTRPEFGCDKITLISALKIGNWQSPFEDVQLAEDQLAENVFLDLAGRAEDYAACGYPFECDYSGRRIKFVGDSPWPYVFLLALSYTNPVTKPNPTVPTGAYILEALAWTGLQRFIGSPSPELSSFGICHHFGSPSLSKLPNAFDAKINFIANEFKEGGNYKPLHSGHHQVSGDDGVDVILRRGFPDKRGAQFLLFGGCAGGENWSSTKRYEVDPGKWLERNFQSSFSGIRGMAKCYFVPRQLHADGWFETSKAAGMIVDRCRLALITHKSESRYLRVARTWTHALCGKAF